VHYIANMENLVFISLTPQEFSEAVQKAVESALNERESNSKVEQDKYAAIPAYCSRRELAKILGIHWQTVNSWDQKGYLKGEKFGALVRYRKQAVIECLELMKQTKYYRKKK